MTMDKMIFDYLIGGIPIKSIMGAFEHAFKLLFFMRDL